MADLVSDINKLTNEFKIAQARAEADYNSKVKALRGPAIKKLLAERDAIDAQLAELGHGAPASAAKKRISRKTPNEEKYCKVCKINGHDARAHRTHKDPFTKDELDQMVAAGKHVHV